MKENFRIDNQLVRAINGDAWHGPALFEMLKGITAEKARRHPVSGVHSIWELVVHINTWQKTVCIRFDGEAYEPDERENWPVIEDYSPKKWEKTLEDLYQTYQTLRKKILELPEPKLEEPVPGQNYDYYVLLHGIIQHTLYHAGQIAILKKKLK